jgi:xanthine/CO dehydrogenase XdhC/CoxF family maturation factor
MSGDDLLDLVRAAQLLEDASVRGVAAVSLHLVDDGSGAPSSRRALLLEGTDTLIGTLGDPGLDGAARDRAGEWLDAPAPALPDPDTVSVAGPWGDARIYVELHLPPRTLVIVGAGHVAQPLATMGALLGMRVVVLDDRPEWATEDRFPEAAQVLRIDFDDPFRDVPIHRGTHVVLVTRGHKYDYECLLRLLRMDRSPAYIGMIGSRRRVRATFAQLGGDGIPPELAQTVRAPIGLDLGAQTPGEIAVAVAAELVQLRHGGTGRPLTEVERVAERFMDSDSRSLTSSPEETP